MALNLNKVVVAGRLTKDPDVRETQSGQTVCSFSVAVNRRVAQGEHPEADFFTVKAWGKTANFVEQYFRKGSAICVCGRLTVNKWEDKNGNKRQDVQITADECLFVESKGASDGAQDSMSTPPTGTSVYGGQAPEYSPYMPPTAAAPNFEAIGESDDLPF